jgi:TRAP-type uncharacterized transport system substrate-binding protein
MQVFISYPDELRQDAWDLCSRLQRDGHDVWLDRQAGVGREFAADIRREIEKRDYFVIIWGARSKEVGRFQHHEMAVIHQRLGDLDTRGVLVLDANASVDDVSKHLLSIPSFSMKMGKHECWDCVATNALRIERAMDLRGNLRRVRRYLYAALGILLAFATAELVNALRSRNPYQSLDVDLYSGTPGGVFYTLGEILTQTTNSKYNSRGVSIRIRHQATAGFVDNCEKLAAASGNQASLTFVHVTANALLAGSNTCSQAIQVVVPLYREVLHLVVKKQLIVDWAQHRSADMRELKHLCGILATSQGTYIGLPKSGTRLLVNSLLEKCDQLSLKNVVDDLQYGQAFSRLKREDGDLDAGFFSLAVGSKPIRNLLEAQHLCLVPITGDNFAGILNFPPLQLQGPYQSSDPNVSAFYDEYSCKWNSSPKFESWSNYVFLAASRNTPDVVIQLALDALKSKGTISMIQELAPGMVLLADTKTLCDLLDSFSKYLPLHSGMDDTMTRCLSLPGRE